jgi:NCS1 family nucleobase:cation symporter-1
VIVLLLAPNWVFDNFGTFLAFIGVVFAPLCGIQIMDYVVFRKHTLDLRAVFLGRRGDAYHYWAGFNPAGFAGLLAGAGTYIYLLDPILFVSRTPYEYLSASLPSALVAGIVYGLITKFVIMPAGLGGYSSPVMTDPRQASFPPSRLKEEVSEPTPP